MLSSILLIVGSYLWAAIPTAYLVARYRKGIDIRRYGSGNMGATNVMTHVGKRTGFLLGTFDCLGKGTLPVVAANLMDQSLAVQAGAGLAAIAGHNWSPYVGFTGGRGVATAIGVVFGFQMWYEFLILAVVMGAIGLLLFRETGFWTFIAMLALPVLAFLFREPPELIYMSLGIGGLLILKRLTANWERPASRYPLANILVYRVLWDRDVPKKAEWTRRRPM
jgi:glycerol-3-phosphate acyltransferase PlsY